MFHALAHFQAAVERATARGLSRRSVTVIAMLTPFLAPVLRPIVRSPRGATQAVPPGPVALPLGSYLVLDDGQYLTLSESEFLTIEDS